MSETFGSNNQGLELATPARSWHTMAAREASAHFGVDSHTGLSAEEARKRLDQYGANQLRKEKRESIWDVFWEEVGEPMILLQVGQRIPADARLLDAYGLAVDESPLTGESVPVNKETDAVLAEETPVAERRNMLFSGTTVTRGRGRAVVVATGMDTELGHIASLTAEVEVPRTLLQRTMRELTRWMVWLALGFSVLGPLLGWLLAGESWQQMVLTGLSLAFATIPEELPIIITIVLALGGYRLSQQRAIAKKLQAVETLGAVSVIATDKTGTLTLNRMEVDQLVPEALGQRLLAIGIMCNDAVKSQQGFTGDPLDTALLRAAEKAGLDVNALRQDRSLHDEFTFDNARKRMSAIYSQGDKLWVAVKGAPEAVLASSVRRQTGEGEQPLSEADRQAMLETAAQMARDGMRVIAFAEKAVSDGRLSPEQAESELTFVGLAGLADRPRPEVKVAVAASQAAGVRTVMITGDHPLTARAIARQIGLDGDGQLLTGPELDALSDEELGELVGQVFLYARTTPQHKLRIVRALQARGERVAVTGDGINDAPALAAADIGIAMGETGTDVAREAADIVLADDNFATIVRAVREGRVLFANLTKGVRYYLAVKVALMSVTLLPVLLKVPLPFAPIQIIIMELFMDLAASATFVAEPPESELMRRPPRDPNLPFMGRAVRRRIDRLPAHLVQRRRAGPRPDCRFRHVAAGPRLPGAKHAFRARTPHSVGSILKLGDDCLGHGDDPGHPAGHAGARGRDETQNDAAERRRVGTRRRHGVARDILDRSPQVASRRTNTGRACL